MPLTQPHAFSRRRMLQLSAGGLVLPFLSRNRPAFAGSGGPKRLILFHYPQGTVMNQFVPQGSEFDFQLPYILEPLRPHKERMIVLTGVDNLMPLLNTVGTQHWNANLTFLTSQPFLEQNADHLEAKGASIEQTVAELIGQETPFQRLDFTVGGIQSDSGIWLPTASAGGSPDELFDFF